jgi:hypothetical protein
LSIITSKFDKSTLLIKKIYSSFYLNRLAVGCREHSYIRN